jgi:hypothetical protein
VARTSGHEARAFGRSIPGVGWRLNPSSTVVFSWAFVGFRGDGTTNSASDQDLFCAPGGI